MASMCLKGLLTAALGVAQLASGAALEARQAPSISDAEKENFELFAKYAMSPYCERLTDTAAFTHVCDPNKHKDAKFPKMCKGLEKAQTIVEFTEKRLWDIGSYVGINEAKQHIVVVFKATKPASFDPLVDLSKRQVESGLKDCKGCLVHEGFKKALDQVKGRVKDTVDALKAHEDKKTWRVVVTGYSLGAAVATLMAVELRANKVPCDLYTYGSPRVGNAEFVKYATSQEGFSARITNGRDLVAAIPVFSRITESNPTYEHIFPEYWYPNGLQAETAHNRFQSGLQICESEASCTSARCSPSLSVLHDALKGNWGLGTFVKALGENLQKLKSGKPIGCSASDHMAYMNQFKACDANPQRRGEALEEEYKIEDVQESLTKLEEEMIAEVNQTASTP